MRFSSKGAYRHYNYPLRFIQHWSRWRSMAKNTDEHESGKNPRSNGQSAIGNLTRMAVSGGRPPVGSRCGITDVLGRTMCGPNHVGRGRELDLTFLSGPNQG